MLSYSKNFSLLAVLISLGLGSANAQSLGNTVDPMELPPAEFAGTQFVDSAGCAFIRAGFDGNVVWVPRVGRDRRQLCGFAPTFKAASTAEVAPKPIVVSKVKQVAKIAPTISKTQAVSKAKLPTGFKKAWNDGRLNPNRGPRSAIGDAQMKVRWTDTVPMRALPSP